MSATQKPATKIVQFERQEVGLRSIEVLPELLQTRAKVDMRVVKVYSDAMASGSIFPPVVVFETPDGRKLLTDGFHRAEACKRLGLRSIPAVIRPGTMEEAILFGIEANFNPDNIREVTEDDRKHAAEVMIRNETFRVWSDRAIALRCGLSHATVRSVRLKLREQENIPIPDRVVTVAKNGVPTNNTMPYRFKDVIPSLQPNKDGQFFVHHNRRKVYLGKDPIVATSKRDDLLREKLERKLDLKTNGQLRIYLECRHVSVSGRSSTAIGGLTCGEVVLFAVAEPTHDIVLTEIGRSVLVAAEEGHAMRVILVGYFEGVNVQVAKVVSLARQLTPPIEFMTPEEVVAEFGPKDGITPTDADDSPDQEHSDD